MNENNIASATPSMHMHPDAPESRKRKQDKKRAPKWTKSARFPGQATFDLTNDMTKVPFAKSRYKSPQVSTNVSSCTSCGVTPQTCLCDPLMKELEEMQEDARRRRPLGTSKSLPAAHTSPLIPHDRLSQRFAYYLNNTYKVSDDPEERNIASPPLPAVFNSGMEKSSSMLLRPEARPITQEQLINEVKGIYAGLVLVEKKCIEIDQQQASTMNKLSDEQWQALIALHRTLLNEHHDFFRATHHPLASPALRDLARKYGMPSRMWEHGIDGFVKSVHYQMPGMAEQMLAYLSSACSVLEKLSVHVPSLAHEWSECIKGLNIYCRELQRILQAGPSSSHWCPSCVSDWTNNHAPPSFDPDNIEHQYQASSPSNIGGTEPISYPNMVCCAPDWCDGLQSNSEATANYSSNTHADQEVYTAIGQVVPEPGMTRQHWGATLSEVASLVLAGWIWVGQASSRDFNMFVKVFAILAMSDMV